MAGVAIKCIPIAGVTIAGVTGVAITIVVFQKFLL